MVGVENFHLDASAPTYAGRNFTETHIPLNLMLILDGSTNGTLSYGSEVIVYTELLLDSAFQAGIQITI